MLSDVTEERDNVSHFILAWEQCLKVCDFFVKGLPFDADKKKHQFNVAYSIESFKKYISNH